MSDQQTSAPSAGVPERPAHVLRVRAEPDGTESAWLDDQPVMLTPGTSPHQSLIRAARRASDRTSPGSVIRVIGSTPDGQTFHMAIGPDGRAWAVSPPPVPARVTPKYVENHSAPAVSALAPISALTPAAAEPALEQPVAAEQVEATEPAVAAEPDLEPADEADDAIPAASVKSPSAATAPVDPNVPVPVDIPEIEVPEPDATLTAAVAALAERPVGRPANGFAKTTPSIPTPARPVPREARPAPRPADTDGSLAKNTAEKAVSKIEGDDETDGPRRRDVLLGVAAGATAMALLGGGAAAAYIAVRRHEHRSVVATPTMQRTGANALPTGINAPVGLPDTFAWSVGGLVGQGSTIATTQTQVFCTTANTATGGMRLEALDATSGERQWAYSLPAALVVSSGPTMMPIGGKPTVVLATPTRIFAWPTTGGSPTVWKVTAKDTVTLTASGVIVQKSGDTAHAFVLYDGALAQRALPSGSTPVAVLGDGSLVAATNDGRAWRITDPNNAPVATQLPAPAGTTPGAFLAATATLLVTAFVPSGNQKQAMVRSFTLPGFTPQTTTQPLQAPTAATFLLSPDQTWAVAGNTWIDMTKGKSHVITALWSPLAISPSLTWAKIGTSVLTADKTGRSLGASTDPTGQTALPRGGTSELTFAVASQGQSSTLYALPMPAGNTEG
ncbi:hypothetical protein [Rudaeicoccus suwonensis]|nr:hypothetical protein [Rudaeicoccus suwonensis]